jgi:hypothetical protein
LWRMASESCCSGAPRRSLGPGGASASEQQVPEAAGCPVSERAVELPTAHSAAQPDGVEPAALGAAAGVPGLKQKKPGIHFCNEVEAELV